MQELAKMITIIGILVSVGTVACAQTDDVSINCKGDSILLEESFFSPSASISPNISPLPEGTKSSVGNAIYLGRGIFAQNIFPFSTSRRAESEFEEELRDPVFKKESIWSPPDNITTLDIKADDYRIACGIQHNIPMCRAILRYDRYFVYVNAHTYEDELSTLDFTTAIQEIDQRLQDCK